MKLFKTSKYILYVKSIAISLFVIVSSYTCYLAYNYSYIRSNPDNYGISYSLPSDMVNGVNFIVDYDNENGYGTGENIFGIISHEIFGYPYKMSNIYINVPIVAPIYSFVLSRPFVYRQSKSKWFLASDTILQKKIGGVLNFARNAGNKYIMKDADNLLILSIARSNRVNPLKMLHYVQMIPLMHELGHAYFKVQNYNNFAFDSNNDMTSRLSEYTAEYISFVIDYSMILKDSDIINKDGALETLKMLYAASRFDSRGDHYGTSLVALLLYKNNQTMISDANELLKSKDRAASLSKIAHSILNMENKRIPRYIKAMFRDDVPNKKIFKQDMLSFVNQEMVRTL